VEADVDEELDEQPAAFSAATASIDPPSSRIQVLFMTSSVQTKFIAAVSGTWTES
jgi:hypothetical protein